MEITLGTPAIIITVILGIIGIAAFAFCIKETIDTFKFDKGLGILEGILVLLHLILFCIYFFCLLFGIPVKSHNTLPMMLPIIIR